MVARRALFVLHAIVSAALQNFFSFSYLRLTLRTVLVFTPFKVVTQMAYSYLCDRFGDSAPRFYGSETIRDKVTGKEITARTMWFISGAYDHARVPREEFERNEWHYRNKYYQHKKQQEALRKAGKYGEPDRKAEFEDFEAKGCGSGGSEGKKA